MSCLDARGYTNLPSWNMFDFVKIFEYKIRERITRGQICIRVITRDIYDPGCKIEK